MPAIPNLADIENVLLNIGELSKADIQAMWGLTEDQYLALREEFGTHRLVEPGPKGKGGFVVKVRKRPKAPPAEKDSDVLLQTAWEHEAVARLSTLLTHKELETLLGDLVYTVRRARTRMTGEDRRGTKTELAAALVIQHGIDLFAHREVRRMVAKKSGVDAPKRWSPGKGAAIAFVEAVGFPHEFVGLAAPETQPDFELLEGRVELSPLEDFQKEVHAAFLGELAKPGGRAIVTLPTGAGKTRVAVDTIRDWLTEGWERRNGAHQPATVLWLAHTEELCEQAMLCFKQVWQASTYVCPLQVFRFWGRYTNDLVRHREDLLAVRERPSCLVSTPNRMVRLLESSQAAATEVREGILNTTELVVIDEAHRAAAPSYRAVLDAFEAAGHPARVIGLTATPFRAEYVSNAEAAGTKQLKTIFRKIIEPKKTLGDDPRRALQERGYLARPTWDAIPTETLLKPPPVADPEVLTEDDIEKVDYALKKRADNPARRLAILEHILPLCQAPETKMIYFGPSVLDAECMAFLLRLRGVSSAYVSGTTRGVTRRRIIDEFKHGDVTVLCNCEVLTTGFDAPRVTHLVMARPTVSQVLYEQMVGRGLRGERFGGTAECVVIDCDDKYREVRPRLGYQAFRDVWQPARAGRAAGRIAG